MSDAKPGRRHLTFMVVPEGTEASRTLRVSYRWLRVLAGVGVVAFLGIVFAAASWWYLAAKAAQVPELEERIAELEAEQVRVAELARQLEEIEGSYGRIRDLFGAGTEQAPSEVWLPPSSRGARGGSRAAATATRPTSWPLSERGFVTQGLLDSEEGQGEHPGLDIAVPTDSYIRAAGAGTVVDVGEDPVYGNFVVVDHGEGYSSLYGHASLTLVERGWRVRRNEVIALSGSTGRSTAPHLHFEILLAGEAVDPLTMVRQP